MKIAPLKIVQRRAEERAEEHLKWNRRRRARAEEMEMIEAVQVVNRGNGEACVQRNRRRRAGFESGRLSFNVLNIHAL